MRIGLAVYYSLLHTWPTLEFSLKAPNDIYVLDGKCAGLLTEVVSSGARGGTTLHVGLGLNVFSKPDLLDQKTAALAEFAPIDQESWFLFCSTLFSEFLLLMQTIELDQLSKAEQKQLLLSLKKYIGNQVKDVLSDGSLVLNDGTLVLWNEL